LSLQLFYRQIGLHLSHVYFLLLYAENTLRHDDIEAEKLDQSIIKSIIKMIKKREEEEMTGGMDGYKVTFMDNK